MNKTGITIFASWMLLAAFLAATGDAAAILREAEHWQKLFLMSFDE